MLYSTLYYIYYQTIGDIIILGVHFPEGSIAYPLIFSKCAYGNSENSINSDCCLTHLRYTKQKTICYGDIILRRICRDYELISLE